MHSADLVVDSDSLTAEQKERIRVMRELVGEKDAAKLAAKILGENAAAEEARNTVDGFNNPPPQEYSGDNIDVSDATGVLAGLARLINKVTDVIGFGTFFPEVLAAQKKMWQFHLRTKRSIIQNYEVADKPSLVKEVAKIVPDASATTGMSELRVTFEQIRYVIQGGIEENNFNIETIAPNTSIYRKSIKNNKELVRVIQDIDEILRNYDIYGSATKGSPVERGWPPDKSRYGPPVNRQRGIPDEDGWIDPGNGVRYREHVEK